MNVMKWNFNIQSAKLETFARQIVLITLCSKKEDFVEWGYDWQDCCFGHNSVFLAFLYILVINREVSLF